MRLQGRRAPPSHRSRRIPASSPCPGRIMPAPLAIPVTVATPEDSLHPRRRRLRHRIGGHDRFGRGQPVGLARKSATACGSPATMRSTGSGSMITPVENGRTWPALQPSDVQARSHTVERPASGRPHRFPRWRCRYSPPARAPGCAGASSPAAPARRRTGSCVNTPATLRAGREPHDQQVLAVRPCARPPWRRRARRRRPGRAAPDPAPAGSLPSPQLSLPWQCLYFLPEPQGQGSLRPDLLRRAHRRLRLSSPPRPAASAVS